MSYLKNKNVLVLGGSGFLGNSVIKLLLENRFRVVTITRNENKIKKIKPAGKIGQIEIIAANIFEEGILDYYTKNKFAVINLCGVLYEKEVDEFHKVHTILPGLIAKSAKKNNVQKLIHISSLGVSESSNSKYSRTKARGEKKISKNFSDAIILRPSLILGNGDNFFGKFKKMSLFLPFLPLVGSDVKFQPIFVEDVAQCILKSLTIVPENVCKIYELGGNEIFTFKELLEMMLSHLKRKRFLIRLNPHFMKIPGFFLQKLPNPPFTVDQMKLLSKDNVVTNNYGNIYDLKVMPNRISSILRKII